MDASSPGASPAAGEVDDQGWRHAADGSILADGADRVTPAGAPAGFVGHTFSDAFVTPHDRDRVWAWLCDPATFTDSQVPPFAVEFVGGGFSEGVLANHYGPLMNFAGVLAAVDEPSYRDLQYTYGSYGFSVRLVRPTRLRFWLAELPEGTRVDLRVDSLVRPRLARGWTALQRPFWARFARWVDRELSL